MDFSPLAIYKVVEAQRVVAIIPHDGIMPGPHTNLIQGPMESVIYYLPCYLAARNHGMEPREAHADAMRHLRNTAGITVSEIQSHG